MTSINFKANYLNSARVQKYQNSEYRPFDASFVKVDLNNQQDLDALKSTAIEWGETAFSSPIYSAASGDSKLEKPGNRHFYILTSQKNSFDKLNPDTILGMAEIDKLSETNSLEYLQVNPKYITSHKKKTVIDKCLDIIFKPKEETKVIPEYKQIGSAILNSLKSIFSDKPMILLTVPEAKKFYKKNGFVQESIINPYGLIWKRK